MKVALTATRLQKKAATVTVENMLKKQSLTSS